MRSPADLAGRASDLAPAVLGATVSSGWGADVVTVRVSEVEAYEGADDPASHAFRGATRRNAVMFGPPGRLYVYFVYGMHWCANVVCGAEGSASALLLRGATVVEGRDVARGRRPAARSDVELARGPARLAQCLGLSREDDGVDLFDPGSRVRMHLPPVAYEPVGIGRGPRVGVAAAHESALRFWVVGDNTVSTYRRGRGPGARNGQTRRP